MSTLSLLFNIIQKVLAGVINQEKEIKGIQIVKEEVKPSLLTDDMILYVENPKEYTHTPKQLLELIYSTRLQDTKLANKNQLYFYTPANPKEYTHTPNNY